jgi:ectoine hydroxylase-related dioxygenase (phytanoyl-CoA dioxygenase family)
MALAVPPDVVATLPERVQELLGYSIMAPFIGYVDGQHPRRLLEPGGGLRREPEAPRS